MLPSNKTRQDALPSKVSQITPSFWILKLLTTGMGEAASDFVLSALHSVGLIIGLIGFALALWVQIRTRTYNPFAYWSAVMMVAVFGTMAADVAHKDFGVPYAVTTGVGVVAAALAHWRFRLNGIVAFWWAYIITRPLGTSVADWLSKPHKAGALGYGDGPVAALLLALTLVILVYVVVRPAARKDTATTALPIELTADASTP